MKLLLPTLLVAVMALAECSHTFIGTNVHRPLVHHYTAKYSSKIAQKRVETYNYRPTGLYRGAPIQGILAYDLTNTSASVNVTSGGIGHNFVGLRMKSDRGEPLQYDIYIYA